ncbi:hypothetical protein N7522_005033 [Penicillium canescens]|nr:hypothetical protein N7522_005033 [Penicillium canescens]
MDSEALQWQITIKQGQDTLEPYDRDEMARLNSWEAVRSLLLDPSNREFTVLKPALSHLNTFVEFFAAKLGPRLDPFALWGALGVLIQVSSESPRATRTMQRVLKSIGYKADSFNACVAAMPVISRQMKETCFDIQVQLLNFFIDAIKCMHGEDGDDGYEKLVQFNLPISIRDKPTLDAGQKSSRKQPYLVLPQTNSLPGRFFDRVDVFEKLDQSFNDTEIPLVFKAVALWGMGGIGKSSIAMRYVSTKIQENKYDAIFWVHGEKSASLRQSFNDIAMKLKLPNASPQNHDENLERVQEWFQFTECAWLVIFDNASSAEILQPYWPSSSRGHAMITTRNPSLAFAHTSSSIEVTSWDHQTGSEFLLFLLRRNIGNDINTEGLSAFELSKRLSGHALGLAHMAGLIHRRSWSIAEFMSIYIKNPRRVHNSELQALWEFSFHSLEPDARQFLGVLAFLMPDDIPQTLFEIDEDNLPEHLKFCSDDFSFSETVETLLMLSLIKRNRDTRVFSTHRMVQAQFKYFLGPSALHLAFSNAVALIFNVFPRQDDEKGQLYEQWAQCNTYLQHVIYLKDSFKENHKADPSFCATPQFCELLVECQRYLFEANLLDDLEDMCQTNLVAVKGLDDAKDAIDITASTLSHLAQMYESIGSADKAVKLNQEGLELRFKEAPLKLPLISGFENNLACAYSTANDHGNALLSLKKSLDTWNRGMEEEGKIPHREPVITANIGRCLFYLDRLPEARQHVDLAVEEFKKSKPINWGGLAYAYFVLAMISKREGNLENAEAQFIDSQNVWLLGDHTRRHPFNGGCLYKIGLCCLDQGKTEAAVKHLRDSIQEVTRFHKEQMPMEHGRNLFKLSEALTQDSPDDPDNAEKLLDEANTYLRKLKPNANIARSEEDFEDLINISWR